MGSRGDQLSRERILAARALRKARQELGDPIAPLLDELADADLPEVPEAPSRGPLMATTWSPAWSEASGDALMLHSDEAFAPSNAATRTSGQESLFTIEAGSESRQMMYHNWLQRQQDLLEGVFEVKCSWVPLDLRAPVLKVSTLKRNDNEVDT